MEPIEGKLAPNTRQEAQMSLPFGIATALVNGKASLAEFSEDQLSNPRVLATTKKVKVHRDSSLDECYPEMRPSWCEITLEDGRILKGSVETSKGEPQNPMTDEERIAKFMALAGLYWEPRVLADIVRLIDEFDAMHVKDIMATAT